MGPRCFRLLACLALLAAGSLGAETLRFQPGRARKLTPGVTHVYFFALKKGDFEELVFDQKGADIEVEVRDPQGRKVVTVDGMNDTQGPEDVPWIAASMGKYQVKVSSRTAGTYVTRTALHHRPTPKDRDRAAAALAYSQGKELKGLKKLQKAEAKFQDAVGLAGRGKDRLREADAWNQLGVLYCEGKRWAECSDSCSRALPLYDALGQYVPAVLSRMATALHYRGDLEQEAAINERFTHLAHEFARTEDEANARLRLGRLQIEIGKIDQALENLQEAAKLYRQQDKPADEAGALISCGRAFSKIGEFDRALAVQGEALKKLRPDKDHSLIAWTFSHLGDTYREAGQTEQAVSYYLRSLHISHHWKDLESEAATSNQLGLAHLRLKDYAKARESFGRALNIFQDQKATTKEANAWINLGSIDLSLNAIPKAIESLKHALDLNRQHKRLNTEASAYYYLAWAERRRNSPAAARASAAHAIAALESMRSANQAREVRTLLLAPWQRFYELQVELLMEQHRLKRTAGYDVEAFDMGERARARTLLESLGERSSPKPLGLREIQQQVLDQDTVLLEYAIGDERSYLWVVTPREYSSFELPGRSQIEPLIQDVRNLLPHSHWRQDREAAERQARALSQILLGPVAQRLGKKRLLIVTPSELQYVPFAALPDLAAEGLPEPDGWWPCPLALRHEIVSAPSASVIAALRAQRAGRPEPPNRLALVADPMYELNGVRPFAGRFESLPSSRVEAEAIAKLAGGGTVLKLYDYKANRNEVMDRLGGYRILHFAVHGDPNQHNPDQSALVLSAFAPGGQPRDPFLRARDIQDQDLPADLAVLSACGTGLGMEVRGEGLVGLTQAFLTAGTSSVVVSLWNVDNTATKKLMLLFYSQLLRRGLRPSAALQKAQIQMWLHEGWNAPSNWAGFIEQGEWR